MLLQKEPKHQAAELRKSLDEGRFELYCQPIASLRGLALAYPMGEIFIRRRANEELLRAPREFLPAMEQYGLMPALDRWVVRRALAHLRTGSRITRFSINVSKHTVNDPSFPYFFGDELSAAGVCGESIAFEIQEEDALADIKATARFAAMARSLGASIGVDGFGQVPQCADLLGMAIFQFLKIDGPLSEQMLADSPDQRWRMLVNEVPRTGVRLVVERVEDCSAIERLKALKVHYAQGYALYKPRSIADFDQPYGLEAA